MKRVTLLAGLFLAVLGAEARAQVVFSVSGTANATGSGFTAGQAVTFNFTLTGASLAGNVANSFNAGVSNQWWEDITSDTQMFTSVSGTGLSGTFMRATATSGDPFSYIQTLPNQLTFTDGAESAITNSIGLVAGGTPVNYILAGNLDWGVTFSTPGTYGSPSAFFTALSGTHALNSGGYADIQLTNGTVINFTMTSLTITSVPEPSVMALLILGLPAIGGLAYRRRSAS
jgi:hypothetical protein